MIWLGNIPINSDYSKIIRKRPKYWNKPGLLRKTAITPQICEIFLAMFCCMPVVKTNDEFMYLLCTISSKETRSTFENTIPHPDHWGNTEIPEPPNETKIKWRSGTQIIKLKLEMWNWKVGIGPICPNQTHRLLISSKRKWNDASTRACRDCCFVVTLVASAEDATSEQIVATDLFFQHYLGHFILSKRFLALRRWWCAKS